MRKILLSPVMKMETKDICNIPKVPETKVCLEDGPEHELNPRHVLFMLPPQLLDKCHQNLVIQQETKPVPCSTTYRCFGSIYREEKVNQVPLGQSFENKTWCSRNGFCFCTSFMIEF